MSADTIPTLIICVNNINIQRFRVDATELEQEFLESCNGFSFDDIYGGDATAWNYIAHRLGMSEFYETKEGLTRESPDLQGRRYLDWESYGSWKKNKLEQDDCDTRGATKVIVLLFTTDRWIGYGKTEGGL